MKFERYLFYFLVLLHLIPVFILPYFVTHDGPAHVYNANLIQSLLFDKDSAAAEFFTFNPQILPNWISHILLALFNLVLEAPLSERIVIAIYTITFPLAFRALVLQINPGAIVASYLVFPFIQAFCILTGLYSFCLGLCLLFFVVCRFQKVDYLSEKNKILWYSLWMLLIYFSHLFVFMLTMLTIGLMISWQHLIVNGLSLKSMFSNINYWWTRIRWLLLVSAIPLLMTLLFSFHQASKTDSEIPEFSIMLELFIDVRPIIALNYVQEKVYSRPLFFVYVVLFVAALIMKFRISHKEKSRFLSPADGWLILSVIMTIFYFFLPDDIFSGGIVAIRFCLMSYLFLILWLSAFSPKPLAMVGAIVSVASALLLLNVRYPALRSLSDDARDFATITPHIPAGKTLATLNYSDNWMMDNIASYIAGDKAILLLDNYEANQVHFPLIWKENRNPDEILGNAGKSNRPCIDLNNFKKATGREVDYILVMKRPVDLIDSCSLVADEALRTGYKEIFRTPLEHGVLYQNIFLK